MLQKLARPLTNRLSLRNKAKLRRLRARGSFRIRQISGRTKQNEAIAQSIAPIFVVGTNRSGSSLCTLILSEHPEIEGLFQGPDSGHRITADGHSSSGAEANHIWQGLNRPDYDPRKGEGVLWGLPDFISKLYVSSVSTWERRQLMDELLSARSTDKIPLVMNSHNVFRIKIIKQLFPKARFVFITRDHQSYIKSGKHKWAADRNIGVLAPDSYIDYPHIGLHWLLINTIALYDLRKNAPGDYIHINLQDLHGDATERSQTMAKVFNFLGLEALETPESVFDDGFIFTRSEHGAEMEMLSDLVSDLIDYESSLP